MEEVFKNKGGLFGGLTGKKYEKSETEEVGGSRWSKPDCKNVTFVAEVEEGDCSKGSY